MLLPLLNAEEVARTQYLMGTICEIRAHGEKRDVLNEAVSLAFQEMARLESLLSTYRPESEVSLLAKASARTPLPVSPELLEIVMESQRLSKLTEGAFDITVNPLVKLWNAANDTLPSSAQLTATKASVGFHLVEVNADRGRLTFLKPGMSLDFGGIGKGYALDKAAAVLRANGAASAFINFGGQILRYGPSTPSRGDTIKIVHPRDPSRSLVRLTLSQGSVSTSSQWEKKRALQGRHVGHIIDPRSGEPVDFLGSVTVLAKTATDADALSTALLVLGPEKGISVIDRHEDAAAFFLVPESGDQWKLIPSRRLPQYNAKPASTVRLAADSGGRFLSFTKIKGGSN